MAEKPRITVVIPTYNQANFLGEAIESALRQTLAGVEVIVVDDGSTDDTQRIASMFGDRIRYIRQPNQGPSVARNTAIAVAQADLIQLLDSDDVLYSHALERIWAVADQNPEAAVLASGWDEMDGAGKTLAHVDPPALAADAFHCLFDPLVVGPASRYLVRRSAIELVGPFDRSVDGCEDWDMWLRIAAAELTFVLLPFATVRYRNYGTSLSKDTAVMWRSGTAVLARAAQAHPGCAQCRRAYRRGLTRYREWCYVSMLAPKLRAYYAQREYRTVARTGFAALSRDPRLVVMLGRAMRRHMLERRR